MRLIKIQATVEALKKQYVILQVAASADGASKVVLSLLEDDLIKRERKESQSGGVNPYPPYLLLDANGCRISMDLHEYIGSGYRVGDVVALELSRPKNINQSQLDLILKESPMSESLG